MKFFSENIKSWVTTLKKVRSNFEKADDFANLKS
jgi:hypothetical protein